MCVIYETACRTQSQALKAHQWLEHTILSFPQFVEGMSAGFIKIVHIFARFLVFRALRELAPASTYNPSSSFYYGKFSTFKENAMTMLTFACKFCTNI